MRIHRAFNLLAGALVLAGVLAPIGISLLLLAWLWATARPGKRLLGRS